MPVGDALFDTLARELARSGIDPVAWALGAARLLPSVVLIPVFGLRALPIFGQILFALILAVAAAPAVQPVMTTDAPWLITLLTQALGGLPVAVSTATTLWVASMAGNLLDELRGGAASASPSLISDSEVSPLGSCLRLAPA